MTFHRIEVDSEVFQFLQAHGRPFVDAPNDVLRRLLLSERGAGQAKPRERNVLGPTSSPVDADSFVRTIIKREFNGTFRRRPPYRMMFESEETLIYCQNFNKESGHLWYRVTQNPWRELRTARKPAWICFTNPAEGFAYSVPVSDIKERVEKAGWHRDFLEVNIDPATSRWTELDWDLSKYRKKY